MSFPVLDAVGLVAAALTTTAFLPQVVQAWRSRSTAGLNLATLATLAAGVVLWLVYGLALGLVPTILANAATLVLVSILLGMKLRDLREIRAGRGSAAA